MAFRLENSVSFSGYDVIEQNVSILTNIYKLHDERLSNIQGKGNLVTQLFALQILQTPR